MESYSLWENDQAVPKAKFYPAIIEMLGYLPLEDLSTYHGVLRSERLRRGLSGTAIARLAGANPAAWTRWERGIYKPAIDFVRNLQAIGIDLTHFNLHGDIVPTPLAKALRKARLERGLTHQRMAEVLGFKTASVWHRFELQGIVPEEKHEKMIYETLGVSLGEFSPDGLERDETQSRKYGHVPTINIS